MKRFLATGLILLSFMTANAQKVDSFYINLYTDSLKKGTHNYINVDGKMSDGSWKPLTAKELDFSADYGKFDGNELILPDNPKVKSVTVTVSLKSDPKRCEKVKIGIKQKPDPMLPAYDADAEMRSRRRRS